MKEKQERHSRNQNQRAWLENKNTCKIKRSHETNRTAWREGKNQP
jgi:hypothetical protein